MPSLPQDPDSPGNVDPAVIAARRALTLDLIRLAARHYEETLAFADRVDAACPAYARPENERGYVEPTWTEIVEAKAWKALRWQADDAWGAAEGALASMLLALYDHIAPEGRRVGPAAYGTPFVPRGVGIGGKSYILNGDPGDRNVVAAVRDDWVTRID